MNARLKSATKFSHVPKFGGVDSFALSLLAEAQCPADSIMFPSAYLILSLSSVKKPEVRLASRLSSMLCRNNGAYDRSSGVPLNLSKS